jgi:tetratricopeptide (TPR) repeat protein
MTLKRILYRVSCCIVGSFLLFNSFNFAYAETKFGKILGSRDKGELNKIINEAEKGIGENPEDKNSLKKLGIAYHSLAHMEVKGTSEKAVEYLRKASKIDPEDFLILAALGSATTMVGRDSSGMIAKVKYTKKGNNMIDKAVAKDPDDFEIRLIRANVNINLPKLFGRKKMAKKDLLYIEETIKKSPKEVPSGAQAQVYYKLGTIYDSDGDDSTAKLYFKKALEISADSVWGEKARKKL